MSMVYPAFDFVSIGVAVWSLWYLHKTWEGKYMIAEYQAIRAEQIRKHKKRWTAWESQLFSQKTKYAIMYFLYWFDRLKIPASVIVAITFIIVLIFELVILIRLIIFVNGG